jgi:hypothetical protein
LLDRFAPPLWLHGHVHPASIESWSIDHGPSQVANVTGAVLVEIEPPEAARSTPGPARDIGDVRTDARVDSSSGAEQRTIRRPVPR